MLGAVASSLVVAGPKIVCVSKSSLTKQTSHAHFDIVYVKLVVEVYVDGNPGF